MVPNAPQTSDPAAFNPILQLSGLDLEIKPFSGARTEAPFSLIQDDSLNTKLWIKRIYLGINFNIISH